MEIVLLHETAHTILHQLVGADLRPDIAHGLIGRAHVGPDEPDQRLVALAVTDDAAQRDVDPLLEELARLDGPHPPADIRHVRGGRGEGDEPLAVEDRLDERDVAHVARALPRVVRDEHITGLQSILPELAEEVPHRRRQRADEGRDAARVLGEGIAARVGEHAGEVIGLVGERGERGPHDGLRRLVGHRDDASPEHLESDGVKACRHWRVPVSLMRAKLQTSRGTKPRFGKTIQ